MGASTKVSPSEVPGRTSGNVSINLQSLSYLRYPETPISSHSSQGETDVRSPRGYDVAGVVGG